MYESSFALLSSEHHKGRFDREIEREGLYYILNVDSQCGDAAPVEVSGICVLCVVPKR